MSARSGFDPLSDLLVAQFAKPADLRELNLRALTPFQRCLLVIDGTVTKFIEAYTMERIEIVLLGQETRTLPSDHVWLDAPSGTTVTVRQVMLRGKHSYRFYAYAVSMIVRDRLPAIIRERMEVDGEGLGRMLYSSRMETYRDILWYGKETLKDVPETIRRVMTAGAISRTYRISAGGQPIMLINEKFPSGEDWLPSHH